MPRAARQHPTIRFLMRSALPIIAERFSAGWGAGGEPSGLANTRTYETDASVPKSDINAASVRRHRPAHANAGRASPGPGDRGVPAIGWGGLDQRRVRRPKIAEAATIAVGIRGRLEAVIIPPPESLVTILVGATR